MSNEVEAFVAMNAREVRQVAIQSNDPITLARDIRFMMKQYLGIDQTIEAIEPYAEDVWNEVWIHPRVC